MTLPELRAVYETRSTKLSDVVRQLAVAGIGIVWVLKPEGTRLGVITNDLLLVAFLMALALALDFLQYAFAALIFGATHRIQEIRGVKQGDVFKLWPSANWPAIACFWGKVLTVGWGYSCLLLFVAEKLG